MMLLVKNVPASAGGIKIHGFDPWSGRFPGVGHGWATGTVPGWVEREGERLKETHNANLGISKCKDYTYGMKADKLQEFQSSCAGHWLLFQYLKLLSLFRG